MDENGWLWQRQQVSVVGALKALACYEYQSCESDDWESTEAFAFCEALRHTLIWALPNIDDAAWEVQAPEDFDASDSHEVERRRPAPPSLPA